MLLKELFDQENIICPEWLSTKMIDDYWQDSTYSSEDGVHKWSFIDGLRNVEIVFDGETYTFGAYSDNDIFTVLEVVTDSEVAII